MIETNHSPAPDPHVRIVEYGYDPVAVGLLVRLVEMSFDYPEHRMALTADHIHSLSLPVSSPGVDVDAVDQWLDDVAMILEPTR